MREIFIEILIVAGIAVALICLLLLFGFIKNPAMAQDDAMIRCYFEWIDGRMRTCCWYPASQQLVCN